MSFYRHRKIYRSDRLNRRRSSALRPLLDHRCDESSTGYSSAGCSPAEPASASPVHPSLIDIQAAVKYNAANGNLSLFSLSQHRGALQSCPEFRRVSSRVSRVSPRVSPSFRVLPFAKMVADDDSRFQRYCRNCQRRGDGHRLPRSSRLLSI